MTIKSRAVLILSCALLAACASPAERAAKRAAAEQVAQADRDKRCASFGYQRGTADYSKCLENLYVQQQQLGVIEEANRQARLQAAAQGLQQAGASLSAIGQSSDPPPQPMFRQPIRCNTIGTTTTCQ